MWTNISLSSSPDHAYAEDAKELCYFLEMEFLCKESKREKRLSTYLQKTTIN